MTCTLSQSANVVKPPGYTHVVEVTGPGRTVYIAGQLARPQPQVAGGPVMRAQICRPSRI